MYRAQRIPFVTNINYLKGILAQISASVCARVIEIFLIGTSEANLIADHSFTNTSLTTCLSFLNSSTVIHGSNILAQDCAPEGIGIGWLLQYDYQLN